MDNERPDLELSVQNMDRRRKDHEQSVSTDPAQLGNRNRIAARISVLPRSVRNFNLLVPMYQGKTLDNKPAFRAGNHCHGFRVGFLGIKSGRPALLVLAPVGFLLGMPFPLGLRRISERSSALGSWAWAVNGFFTVIGTVLAQVLGMMIGFRMVLLIAATCYFAALLIVYVSDGENADSKLSLPADRAPVPL